MNLNKRHARSGLDRIRDARAPACPFWRPPLSGWVLLLLLALTGATQAQFSYVTNNGAITITGYTGPGGSVIIPSTINGLPVTSIGESAFYYKPSLTNVTIPSSVLTLEASAFESCY